MVDVRAIKGLILGAVAMLIAALAFVILQLAQGPGGLHVPEAGLTAAVPKGAFALLHFDTKGVLDTALARSMVQDPSRQTELTEALEQVHAVDAFVLTPEAASKAGDRAAVCGVIRMGSRAHKELLDLMADEGKRVKAGDFHAYQVKLEQRAPLGFAPPGGAQGAAVVFMAPAGRDAVAVATSQGAFRALAEALAAGAPSAEPRALADMARAAGSDPFWIALDGPTTLALGAAQVRDAPDIVKGVRAALLSVAVDEDVRARGLVRFGSEADAAEALSEAQKGLDQARAGFEEGTATPGIPVAAAAAILNRVSLSASGPDMEATIVLSGEDLQQMLGLVFMSALAAGMQAQGGS